MASGRVHGLPAPVRTVAPTSEPVSIEEAKAQLRLDDFVEDDLVEALIAAARSHLDGYSGILGRALITQTWRQTFPAFDEPLRLPLRPVASVSSVTYYDANNASQTLSSAVYGLFADALGSYVALKPGQTFPTTYDRRDAVSVTFVCGESEAPAAIKQAMLLLIGHWYANREAVVIGGPAVELPMAVAALLRPFSTVGV
jgi:uncharacterized phiE125 gp8 family phage protein